MSDTSPAPPPAAQPAGAWPLSELHARAAANLARQDVAAPPASGPCAHEYELGGVAYKCQRAPHPIDGYGLEFRHAAEIDAEQAKGTDADDGFGRATLITWGEDALGDGQDWEVAWGTVAAYPVLEPPASGPQEATAPGLPWCPIEAVLPDGRYPCKLHRGHDGGHDFASTRLPDEDGGPQEAATPVEALAAELAACAARERHLIALRNITRILATAHEKLTPVETVELIDAEVDGLDLTQDAP